MPFDLVRGEISIIAVGGVTVLAAYGPMLGGFITNPSTNIDQGIGVAEPLYYSFSLVEGSSFALQPGETFSFPDGLTNNVYVRAASSGHRFNLIIARDKPTVPAARPLDSNLLVSESTLLHEVIQSYLYQQYNDDDDLLSFVMAYNELTQQFIDWFNSINLPVYTQDNITGALLDWVAQGLYGLTRPVIASGQNQWLGDFNTYTFNQLPLNGLVKVGNQTFYYTDDDNFKRMLTWLLFKADGKVFNIRWLKRRIVRYLQGINGSAPNVDNTYQVSVSFGVGNQVNINIGLGTRTITGGALYNQMLWNGATFNQMNSTFVPGVPNAEASVLKAAIADGVAELPFQFTYVVNIL